MSGSAIVEIEIQTKYARLFDNTTVSIRAQYLDWIPKCIAIGLRGRSIKKEKCRQLAAAVPSREDRHRDLAKNRGAS